MLKPYYDKKLIEVGCDEAGRGCLAGPVVAAAVILPKDFKNKELNDSKKLSEKQRDKLLPIITNEAIAWAVGVVNPKEIDKINILNASFKAMHIAIDKLKSKPELILVDGNRFNEYKKIMHKCIIKGDSKYMSIAAASVIAKTYRDEMMCRLHLENPEYLWSKNKGYPTKEHRDSIQKNGSSKHHRKSFTLLKK